MLFFAALAVGSVFFFIMHRSFAERLIGALQRGKKRQAQDLVDKCHHITEAMDGQSLLVSAIEANMHSDTLLQLIRKGANVNARGKDGWTPLHCAVYARNCVQLCALLLEQGADVNAQNVHGSSALHLASCAKERKLVKMMIGAGGNVNLRNLLGETPLHYAVKSDAVSCAKLLIRHGAVVVGRVDGDGSYIITSLEMDQLLRRAIEAQALIAILVMRVRRQHQQKRSSPAIARLPHELVRTVAGFL